MRANNAVDCLWSDTLPHYCLRCGWTYPLAKTPPRRNCPAWKPRGVGDTVARWMRRVGLQWVAQLVSRKTGRPCGCGRRQALLNSWLPYR